jgi:(p)ppGpp synthase/HD superfamily hydrolase
LGLPINYVIAALLHDTTEDCDVMFDEIRAAFGSEVELIVHFMDKIKLYFFNHYKEKLKFYLKKQPQLILVRLADSLSNLREAEGFRNEFSREKAAQNALGLLELANELLIDSHKYLDFFEKVRKEANKYA